MKNKDSLRENLSTCSSVFSPHFVLSIMNTDQRGGCIRFLIKNKAKTRFDVQLTLKINYARESLFISNNLTSAFNFAQFYLDLKQSLSNIQVTYRKINKRIAAIF
jgi:hypothetical protein